MIYLFIVNIVVILVGSYITTGLLCEIIYFNISEIIIKNNNI